MRAALGKCRNDPTSTCCFWAEDVLSLEKCCPCWLSAGSWLWKKARCWALGLAGAMGTRTGVAALCGARPVPAAGACPAPAQAAPPGLFPAALQLGLFSS